MERGNMEDNTPYNEILFTIEGIFATGEFEAASQKC